MVKMRWDNSHKVQCPALKKPEWMTSLIVIMATFIPGMFILSAGHRAEWWPHPIRCDSDHNLQHPGDWHQWQCPRVQQLWVQRGHHWAGTGRLCSPPLHPGDRQGRGESLKMWCPVLHPVWAVQPWGGHQGSLGSQVPIYKIETNFASPSPAMCWG